MKKYVLILICIMVTLPSFAQGKIESFQQALMVTSKLNSERGPSSVNWIEGGNRYSYLIYNRENQRQEIRAYNPAKDEDVLIFDGAALTFPETDEAFRYQSFQWAGDSKHLLFQTNFRPIYRRSGISDYYFYSIDNQSLELVAKDAGTAELSPDGTKVGFERDGNLYFYDFQTQTETQLTFDGAEHLYNGKFGWVYEEEFGLAQAWYWSPDSKYIAFWQENEEEVPVFQMTDYEGQHADYVKIRYPIVGDTNPTMKIGVANIATSKLVWMNIPIDGEYYVPRLNWTTKNHTLSVMTLNRAQTELNLFFFDVRSGEGKLVMNETSDVWIDVFDFFAGINHFLFFPDGGKEFFWLSDRDGWSHIYRYNYDGKMLNQVTKGEWEVTYVQGIDDKKQIIYYTSTEDSPLERHLYSINYKGKKKKKISKVSGRHSFNMSPNTKYIIDSYSNISQPQKVDLIDTKGKLIKNLADNSKAWDELSSSLAQRSLFSFTTTDGQKLDGYIMLPVNFDSTQSYPLILGIYGGPSSQGVYNQFGTSAWEHYLTQKGYVIANVNNRGNGGYGRDFEKMVYKQLGKWEAYDFAETAKYLGSLPYIDSEKMAIRGHSYGGYMAVLTALLHPDVFKVSISGAPVTDWRLYDSIYTERYMGLIEDNEEGYITSSATTHAANLKSKLLLVHSAMDENVHMQNTMQLITALTRNGIDADVRIYPPGAHGVAFDRNSYMLLYNLYIDYLDTHLKN